MHVNPRSDEDNFWPDLKLYSYFSCNEHLRLK